MSRARYVLALSLSLFPAAALADDAKPCTADDGLSEAAAELLLTKSDLTADSMSQAAQRVGSDLPVIHGLRVAANEDTRINEWRAGLAAKSDAPLVCGRAEDGSQVVVLVAARAGRLVPDAANQRRFRIELAPGFTAPDIIVQNEAGDFAHVAVPVPNATIEVPEDLDPPFKVQLMALGKTGPRPVSERLVGAWVGAAAPSTTDAAEEGDAAPPDTDPHKWLASYRELRHVGSLRNNRLLDAAANAHAERVCAEGRVAHKLEAGDPKERLLAEGLSARIVGEAVARSRSRGKALRALSQSPSHAMTLLDPRFTDVGTGEATDPAGNVCVTLVLAAWPRVVPKRAMDESKL